MAAEVKVLVKAENQTKTGFQAALNDAKKFGQEASRAASSGGGIGGVDGKGIRSAIKGLGSDLASASTPAEALQSIVTRVAGAFGKVTAVVGAFAVGKVLAAQFEKLSQAVVSGTQTLKEFSNVAEQTAQAATFEGAASGFDSMQSKIKETQQSLTALKSDFGAVWANGVTMMLTGKNAFGELSQMIAQMQSQAAQSLNASAQKQAINSKNDLLAFANGGKEGLDAEKIRQKRDEERRQRQQQLESTPVGSRDPVYAAMRADTERYTNEDKLIQLAKRIDSEKKSYAIAEQIYTAKQNGQMQQMSDSEKLALLRKRQAGLSGTVGKNNKEELAYYQYKNQADELQASINKKQRDSAIKRASEKIAIAREAEAQKKKNEYDAMTPAERLAFEQSGLASLAGKAGPEAELQRQQTLGRIGDLQRQMQSGSLQQIGSLQASSLQRIGGARNEFADSRGVVQESRKQTNLLQKIEKNTAKETAINMKP